MDRAAKLAAEAREYLANEVCWSGSREQARQVTRICLAECAADFGFATNEISSAIDQALTDAGATP